MIDELSIVLNRSLGQLALVGFNRLSSRFRRVRAVDKALNYQSKTLEPAIATAMNDITTVVGKAGLLTTDVAEFFDELANTGLAERIAMASITERDSLGTFSAFVQLSRKHSNAIAALSQADVRALYESLLRMFRASLLNNQKANDYFSKKAVEALLEISGELEEQIGKKFAPRDHTGSPLTHDAIVERFPWLAEPRSRVREVSSKLARLMEPTFSHIRVEGPSQRSVEIQAKKIYVESEVRPLALSFDAETVVRFESREAISIDQFLSALDRAALVGDPGGGKTTTIRMICKDLCEAASNGAGPMPMFVTLRKYQAALEKQPTLSLLEYLFQELSQRTNRLADQETHVVIQSILEFGSAIVVFDGLDEILSVPRRRDIATYIRQFCSSYPLCRFIATSRKLDYTHVSIPGFDTFELCPFDDGQVRKYVELSARNVFKRPEREIEDNVRRFMREVDKDASEFKTNPLLLSLIVWLFNSTTRIPDNRAEIYRECSELLFKRWDALREISSDVPDAHRLFSLLSYLAEKMYLEPAFQAGASRHQIRDAIRDFFVSDYSDNALERAAAVADRLLEHLAGRAWVLRALGSDSYEFTHRTFMEYFFALRLLDQNLSLDSLFERVKPRLLSGEWTVPIHLAFQIAVSGKRLHSEHLVNRLLELYDSLDERCHRSVIVTFVAHASEYLQPPERSLERIAKVVTLEIENKDAWRRLFISVLRTSNEMRAAIFRGLSEGLREAVGVNKLHKMSFLLDWFKAQRMLGEKYFLESAPTELMFPPDSIDVLVKNVLEELEDSELKSAAGAKARFDILEEFDPDAATRFGVRLWQASSEGPLDRLDWRVADFAAMVLEFYELLSGERSIDRLRYGKLAVAVAHSDLPKVAPILITSTPMVQPRGFDRIGFDSFETPGNLDADYALALCFTAKAFHELRGIGYGGVTYNASSSRPDVIYATWRSRLNIPNKLQRFYDDWMADRRELFQPISRPHPSVALNDVLK